MSAVENTGNHQSLINQESGPKVDPLTIFSHEIVLTIFSHLNLASLGAVSQVSKKWNELAGDTFLWKKAIYREFAFSNDDWAKELGEGVVKDEDRAVEFASLPPIEAFRKAHAAFPGRKLADSHYLVRKPKTLCGEISIRCAGQILKKYFPDNQQGYRYIWDRIMTELGDEKIKESCWLFGTKEPLLGSRAESYAVQQRMVEDLAASSQVPYEVPEPLDVIIAMIAEYMRSGTRLFSDSPMTYTRCQKSVQSSYSDARRYQVAVGGCAPAGLNVSIDYNDGDDLGVSALGKFYERRDLET